MESRAEHVVETLMLENGRVEVEECEEKVEGSIWVERGIKALKPVFVFLFLRPLYPSPYSTIVCSSPNGFELISYAARRSW